MELRELFDTKGKYIEALYQCLDDLNTEEDSLIKTYAICNILKELFVATGTINDI